MITIMAMALFTCGGEPQRELVERLIIPATDYDPLALPADSPLVPLDESDPNYQLITSRIASLVEGYEKSELFGRPYVGEPRRVTGKAIEKLFPGHWFYAYWYMAIPATPQNPPPAGTATFTCHLAIGKDGSVTTFSRYDQYDKFLAKTGIEIRDSTDVRNVWDAFCEIYRLDWKKRTIEKVSDTLWRVGPTTDGTWTYWYEIRLNDDLTVASARSRAVNNQTGQELKTPDDS